LREGPAPPQTTIAGVNAGKFGNIDVTRRCKKIPHARRNGVVGRGCRTGTPYLGANHIGGTIMPKKERNVHRKPVVSDRMGGVLRPLDCRLVVSPNGNDASVSATKCIVRFWKQCGCSVGKPEGAWGEKHGEKLAPVCKFSQDLRRGT